MSPKMLRALSRVAFADALKVESDEDAMYLIELTERLERAADDAEESEAA